MLHNRPGEPVRRYKLADLVAKLELSLDAGRRVDKPAGLPPGGPSDVFKQAQAGGEKFEGLNEGITKDHWFARLTPEQKDAAVHYMLSVLSTNPVPTEKNPAGIMVLERRDNGGENSMYSNLITALAQSGAPHAEDYFVEFASKAKDADPEEALREKFRDCARLANGQITVGTLLHYARQAGADLSPRVLAERGWMGYPAIKFRDFTTKGKPRPSLANAVIAIKALGIEIRQDLFHHRTVVKHNGAISTVQEGILTDDTVGAIRSLINNTYQLDCGRDHTYDAIKEIARDHAFDPVLDYLAEGQGKWDGQNRIDMGDRLPGV